MGYSFDRHLLRRIMRAAFWFGFSFALVFLVRVPFLLIHYIPYHLPFEPWIALIPLLGVFWGMPAVLGIGLATALADVLGGLRDSLPAYHALAMMVWAWSARTLWSRPHGEPARMASALTVPRQDGVGDAVVPPWSAPLVFLREDQRWAAAWRFLWVSVPGAAMAAVWMGLGTDLTRTYPFAYVARIAMWNHAVFLLVFAVVAFRAVERDMVPRFGTCDEYGKSRPGGPSWLGMWLQIAGAAGALALGLAVSIRLGYPARGPVALGDTIGYRLLPGIVPFIILHAIGLLCPKGLRTPARPFFNRNARGG